MPRTPACRGCCVRQTGCTSCARCLPRYLCVAVDVTPGPDTDTDCCQPDPYGDGHFDFRLTHGCGDYSGSGTCAGLESSLDLSIELVGDYPNCQTVVSSPAMDYPITFDGVLPAGMTGEAITPEGDILTWTISRAAVIENPLALERCSPCTCATCLPERLCVTVSASGDDGYFPAISDALSFLWDCTTRSWMVDGVLPDGFDISLALAPAADGVCGVYVDVSGDYGSYSGTILLEGPLDGCKVGGTVCKDSDDLTSTRGVPALLPDCETDNEPQEFTSYVNTTFNLMDGDAQTGSVTIRDQSCGECVAPCRCCPEMPDTLFLTLDTTCWYGVIELHRVSNPDSETTLWQSVPGSTLTQLNTDTIPPFPDIEAPGEVTAFAGCVKSAPGIYWGISALDATPLFAGSVESCAGGTVAYNDPRILAWSIGGSHCAFYGIGNNGSLTVSA